METTHVGEYEVIIVKYGTRSTVKSDVYLNFGVYGKPDDPIDMDYFFWVVRNAERTIIVDTGFSQQGGTLRRRTFLIDPAEACEALGIVAEEVDTVVITHAHYDHAGNLGLFPDAEVIIAEKEYEFWTGRHSRRAQFHHSIEEEDIEDLREIDKAGRLRTWNGQLDLVPGVTLIEIGGHTPGQAAVLVQTSEGPVLLASDSMHYYEEFEHDMPFAFVGDLVGMYEGFDTIRQMVESGDVKHLVSGHDPDTLSRFNPVQGRLAGLAATIGGQQ